MLQLQGFSVNDGEGVRTTIFLPGCPLRCKWCANPETWTARPKLAVYRDKCTLCGACQALCPAAYSIGSHPAHSGCTACGACQEVCLTGARKILCSAKTVEQVLEKIRREAVFYRYSGGGVTFSGGEPTVQLAFLRSLAEGLDEMGISMWMETCGYFNWSAVEDILARLDHVLYDIKCMDGDLHREMTGVDNAVILENAVRIARKGIPITVRIPLMEEVNCTRDNLAATARFVRESLPGASVELLPYHDLGCEKYGALGMEDALHRFTTPGPQRLRWARELVEDCGIKVVAYR